MSVYASFWNYVVKTDDCWLWIGSTSPDGYGRASTYKSHGTTLPHRALWIDENGPIPDGMELDHLCETRNCVRPSHLEVVTHDENVRRAVERRTECRNGHSIEFQVSDYKGGRRCLICRRKANRESTARWRKANQERINAYAREYRARKQRQREAA